MVLPPELSCLAGTLTELHLSLLDWTTGLQAGELTVLTRLQLLATQGWHPLMLPTDWSALRGLTALSLGYSHLGEVPACVSTLTALRHLELCGSSIFALPTWIGRLKQLSLLDLSGLRDIDYDADAMLVQLTLPTQIAELHQLRSFLWAPAEDEDAPDEGDVILTYPVQLHVAVDEGCACIASSVKARAFDYWDTSSFVWSVGACEQHNAGADLLAHPAAADSGSMHVVASPQVHAVLRVLQRSGFNNTLLQGVYCDCYSFRACTPGNPSCDRRRPDPGPRGDGDA